MDKTKIASVVVVAIVVVMIAVAFVFTQNNDSDDTTKNEKILSSLMLYGNANDDYTISDADKEIAQKIIDKEEGYTLDKYPLADANHDGKVDGKDLSLLQDIIDRKQGINVYVLCLDVQGNQTAIEVKYPLNNVVPLGVNIIQPLLLCGGGSHTAGFFANSYPISETSMNSARNLHGSARDINEASWKNFNDLDVSLQSEGGIGAFVLDSSIKSVNQTYWDQLAKANIPLLVFDSADAKSDIRTTLTLGFLFGKDTEEIGAKYAERSWDVIDRITSEVEGISDADRSKYISFNMYIYICGPESMYNTNPATAGGVSYHTVNSEFAAKYTKNVTKMDNVEALSNYTDVDAMINYRSIDYGVEDRNMEIVKTFEHSSKGAQPVIDYFKDLQNADRLAFVNNLLPGAVRVAYTAVALYPALFTEEWADGILQDFIDDGYDPLKGQTQETILAFFNIDDYNNALKNPV